MFLLSLRTSNIRFLNMAFIFCNFSLSLAYKPSAMPDSIYIIIDDVQCKKFAPVVKSLIIHNSSVTNWITNSIKYKVIIQAKNKKKWMYVS